MRKINSCPWINIYAPSQKQLCYQTHFSSREKSFIDANLELSQVPRVPSHFQAMAVLIPCPQRLGAAFSTGDILFTTRLLSSFFSRYFQFFWDPHSTTSGLFTLHHITHLPHEMLPYSSTTSHHISMIILKSLEENIKRFLLCEKLKVEGRKNQVRYLVLSWRSDLLSPMPEPN